MLRCDKCGRSDGCEVKYLFTSSYVHCPSCEEKNLYKEIPLDGISPNGWRELHPDLGSRDDSWNGIGWTLIGHTRPCRNVNVHLYENVRTKEVFCAILRGAGSPDKKFFALWESIQDVPSLFFSTNALAILDDFPESFDLPRQRAP